MARKHNFYAGPAALPLEVLEEAQKELLDFQNSGCSVLETSHRSKEYDKVHMESIALMKELMGLDDKYQVLLLQGGASLQFAMVPMNFMFDGKSADYIITGSWSKKALKEAKIIGTPRVAATTEKDGVFTTIPAQNQLDLDAKAVYCHITSNNTIFGTQWQKFPNTGSVPLVADMSSDILSHRFDPAPFGLIYAGAQKNLGPAGLTVVIVRNDMLEKTNPKLPTMLSYNTHAKENSLYNTCPCFPIYIMNKVLHWLKDKGGVAAMEKINDAKAKLLYGAIDGSGGYYHNPIPADSRSKMNVVFRLAKGEEIEKKFVAEGTAAGFLGIKGHRSVGGIRVSMYNATSLASIEQFVAFMKDFAKKNG
jgi:phosphoserine aminotransferase